VDGGGRHQARGGGFVAAGHQHYAVEGVTTQYFDQAKIGEIAIQSGGGTATALLHGMDWKLKGDTSLIPDSIFHARRQRYMNPIARREISAGLGDSDNRPA